MINHWLKINSPKKLHNVLLSRFWVKSNDFNEFRPELELLSVTHLSVVGFNEFPI